MYQISNLDLALLIAALTIALFALFFTLQQYIKKANESLAEYLSNHIYKLRDNVKELDFITKDQFHKYMQLASEEQKSIRVDYQSKLMNKFAVLTDNQDELLTWTKNMAGNVKSALMPEFKTLHDINNNLLIQSEQIDNARNIITKAINGVQEEVAKNYERTTDRLQSLLNHRTADRETLVSMLDKIYIDNTAAYSWQATMLSKAAEINNTPASLIDMHNSMKIIISILQELANRTAETKATVSNLDHYLDKMSDNAAANPNAGQATAIFSMSEALAQLNQQMQSGLQEIRHAISVPQPPVQSVLNSAPDSAQWDARISPVHDYGIKVEQDAPAVATDNSAPVIQQVDTLTGSDAGYRPTQLSEAQHIPVHESTEIQQDYLSDDLHNGRGGYVPLMLPSQSGKFF